MEIHLFTRNHFLVSESLTLTLESLFLFHFESGFHIKPSLEPLLSKALSEDVSSGAETMDSSPESYGHLRLTLHLPSWLKVTLETLSATVQGRTPPSRWPLCLPILLHFHWISHLNWVLRSRPHFVWLWQLTDTFPLVPLLSLLPTYYNRFLIILPILQCWRLVHRYFCTHLSRCTPHPGFLC